MTHASRPPSTAPLSTIVAPLPADCAQGAGRTRQALKALVASVVVLAVAATALFLIHLRDIHLKAAEAHAADFTLLLGNFVTADVGRSPETWDDLTLGLPGPGSAWIADRDGTVIRGVAPHGPSMAGDPVMLALRDQPHGVVRGPSALDGIARISAYRLVERLGVVVVTSVAVADVLAPWRSALWVSLGFLLAIALVLGTLAALAFRSLSREETMMARRNAEDARAANNSKTRFLAAASHDLRQPLQAAGMFVEVLAVRLDGSANAPIIDKIRQSLDSTQALLTMLLDISTLEAGRVTPNPGNFALAPLLAGLVEQMEPAATARKLKLRLVPTSAWVHSDPVLLERILRNLLANAIRYTAEGGVLIGCRRRGANTVIQVVDSGSGIAADKLDAVFEEFTRLHEPGGSGGLGLGLAVVRRTARLLGHSIEVRSQPGKGSSFGIVVPSVVVPSVGPGL